MRVLRNAMAVVVCLVALWYWLPFRIWWTFDRIEHRAKKRITAAELQTWATNLLALYPSNASPTVSELGTNFPRQLLAVFDRHQPYIVIFEKGTNSPASIRLVWGSGFLGHCGFEIGPTDFVSYHSHARAWQPGVYFWSDQPPK